MGKTVYWIDDSVQKLMYIMQGIIPELWNLHGEGEKITSKILMFGNEYQKPSCSYFATIDTENELAQALKAYFSEACRRAGEIGGNRDLHQQNYALVEDSVKVLFKAWTEQEEALVPEDKREAARQERQEKLKFFEDIKRVWVTGVRNTEEDAWKKEAAEVVTKLIDLMELEDGACVGIDLALLFGDRDRILNADKPVIAMEIYHQLSQEHFCFLYSTYTYANNLVPKCEKVYKSYYSEDCRIYRRSEMMPKRETDTVIQAIRNA